SNEDVRFARARVRRDVVPALRELNPAVERAIAETALLLRDEANVLDLAVDEVGPAPFALDILTELPPAVARLALRGAIEAAAALGSEVTVRAWREGDRMRPAGLGGTKTLQDLFTDRKVPRAERVSWPVVEAGGEIACVPAVAVGEGFRPDGGDVVGISARRR